MLSGSRQQMFLNGSAHIVHRSGAVARHMKAVNHDFGLRKEESGNITVALVHIHHHILHILSVGEGAQVGLDGRNPFVRQNIQDMPLLRRCRDALEPFAVCVALEFIEGKHRGQRLRLALRIERQTARNPADRGSGIPGNVLHAPPALQQPHDSFCHLIGKVLIPAEKCAALRKFLATCRAEISAPAVQQFQGLSADAQIPYCSDAIIIHLIVFSLTPWTSVPPCASG